MGNLTSTVCYDLIDLQRKKYNIFLEIITCNPSIYTLDHPDLTISLLVLKRLKNDFYAYAISSKIS